jgi:hypothetical protein
MVGVQMARHWHIVQNEMGILIFTQYPLMEEKKRLTISDGLDDGPDYSSDGKYIYFNSYRTGHMQIWRMQSDGTNQEQLTLMIIQIGLHIHHLITNGSHLFHTCLMRSKITCLASMFN